MPRKLLADLPGLRVHVRTATHNHFYASAKYDGRADRLDLVYRGVVGTHRRRATVFPKF